MGQGSTVGEATRTRRPTASKPTSLALRTISGGETSSIVG